jgi:apolipoprotein N-acyltransferase
MTLSWQPFKALPFIFIGLIPLFYLEAEVRKNHVHSSRLLFLAYTFLSLFLFNCSTVYWIWNASPEGAIAAFFINTLMMTLPLLIFHITRKREENSNKMWAFIFLWLTYEWLHTNWQFSFPWLSLGNVFSYTPFLVQWYEYTGVAGGSLWVVLVNYKLYILISTWKERSPSENYGKIFNLAFFFLFTPIFLSFYIANDRQEKGANIKRQMADIVLVQPNIDPYKDKFEGMTPEVQTDKILALAETKIDSLTQFVMMPETALLGSLEEGNLQNAVVYQKVLDFLEKHPNIGLLSGADTHRFYQSNYKPTITARKYSNVLFYDVYNTALYLSKFDSLQIYHKSKLVPGVERMPYPEIFGFLEKVSINLGGTSGSLASNKEAKVFYSYQKTKLAPIICFESVFPDYVASYVKKGADILCIITNDGWWGNTPGFRQHFDFARLRAIENRRWVARSANTGISGFIDEKGEIVSESEWWKEAVLRAKVPLHKEETFFTQNGDLIGFWAMIFSLYEIFKLFRRKP